MKILDRFAILVYMILSFFLLTACKYADDNLAPNSQIISEQIEQEVIVGAQRIAKYHPLVEGKSIGVVVNQTSTVGNSHLVDTLLALGVNIKSIFAPEHGFRGEADAGETIKDGRDSKTELPIVSLYGKNKKPSPTQMEGLDAVVFDIQDVGARFYTYISTLHYVMEACAEANIPIIVLDRPNPNAHFVDGPVMKDEYKSFVGMHPVPVVYGMTIGEYAQMINGEKWLADGLDADLTVISCKSYTHDTFYELPIKPSPNLPNIRSILLYPSLCFFEGTTVSVGRGTDKQFQVYGHPKHAVGNFTFNPIAGPGSKFPKHEGKSCRGYSLESATLGSLYDRKRLDLSYLISMHQNLTASGTQFFNDNNFFEKLAGTASLRKQITEGISEELIRKSWESELEDFMSVRAKYLIYD